ncbi:TPA: hypothetical protein N0F65_010143, partial [Lagenidium giganteum]
GNDKFAPLHKAAEQGSVECCELLLQHGADPAAKNHAGQIPLHFAVFSASVSCCELLLQYGSDPNTQVSSCPRSRFVCGIGQIHCDEQQDNNDRAPLHEAVAASFVECCEILISYGADAVIQDAHGRYPLHLAKRNDDSTQELLIGHHFDWDANIFRRLCEQGKATALRRMLEQKSTIMTYDLHI